MEKRTDLKIPYGVSDFKTIRTEGLYYVDKTEYLAKLEERDRFVFFVRPRRFGKSLFLDMLRLYYDRNEKENFGKLFGGLWIGSHPTANRNRYLMLKLDFSMVGGMGGATLPDKFANYMDVALDDFIFRYRALFPADAFAAASKDTKFAVVTTAAKSVGLPLYLVIDEYDNFTNTLIRSAGTDPYRTITHGAGFYREWFKQFKGTFDRIFMTGVSPVTLDDLTSGFNIAANVSQDEEFNAMLGFSEAETLRIYRDFHGVGKFTAGTPEAIVGDIKPWYDGYCFATEKIGVESVFNSDMVLYHLKSMVAKGRPPENMVDVNISTDYDKLETIVDLQRQAGAQNAEDVSPLTEELAAKGEIAFDLVPSFPADAIIRQENFRSLFHYYGILSMSERKKGMPHFRVPNQGVRLQIFNYLRDRYRRERMPDWIGWSHLASAMAYDGEWEPFLRRLAEDLKATMPVRGNIDREIRIQGYMQAEFGHLKFYRARPELELAQGFCDFCLFPERVYYGDAKHSYIVELKHSAAEATDAELSAKADEGISQLRRYAADPFVPDLARDTTLHLILYQFKGFDLHRLEEIPSS